MLGKHVDRSASDLKDPLLSALLKDAFANDPALAESPGRTEHIMRKVLSSGVRPVRHFNWASFAWTSGTIATAAAVVVFAFMLVSQPKTPVAKNPLAPVIPPLHKTENPTTVVSSPPEVKEKPTTAWDNTAPKPTSYRQPVDRIPEKPEQNLPAATDDDSQTQVASALIEAGSAASSVGDYESAYQSYQASYEISPTPNSLVASGRALERMADQVLEQDNSST